MFQPTRVTARILTQIQSQFDELEEAFYLPMKCPSFKDFLKNYHGLGSINHQLSFEESKISEQCFFNIGNIFSNIFACSGIAEYSENETNQILIEVEKSVNLIIYYWIGHNDRNYQFRTLIHFFNLNDTHIVFLTKDKKDYCIKFNENGMLFGELTLNREPLFLAVSKICALHKINENSSLRVIFARLRTVQREVCLLVDEWEHLNALLAVQYSTSYNVYQKTKTKQDEETYSKLSQKLSLRRDTLAEWCLESFCDFQDWITELLNYKSLHEDILAEIDAVQGVLLSALQKIFLPASVSRHCYADCIPPLLERFARARIKVKSDDISAHFLLQVASSAQGKEFSPDLLSIVNKKPFEWIIAFDPSSALKAFSWKYSKETHYLLTALYAISFFKKATPNDLDELYITEIAVTLQMPDSFPQDTKNRSIFNVQLNNITSEEVQNIFSLVYDYFDKNIKKTKRALDFSSFIISSLQNLRV